MGDLSGIDFDSIDEKFGAAFELLPCGVYDVKLTDASIRDNKAGDGTYLAITFEVIDGDHHGRKFWENLTLSHPNPVAAKIGKASLKRLIMACGLRNVESSCELLGHRLSILIGQRKRKDNGEVINTVRAFSPPTNPAASIAKPAAKGVFVPTFLKG